jgi:23S rRNA pseudouridine2605 synthase
LNSNQKFKVERLQKILSAAGIASRREAEKLILAGRVKVNGLVVTRLGTQADLSKDRVEVDGRPVTLPSQKVCYLFHKPENVMVTRRDPEGRPTVFDYLKAIPERVNPVGRLDFDSEGLLLLTNDGELHARLTHPRHEVPKVYRVKAAPVTLDLKKLSSGLDIGDVVTQPCVAKVIKENPHNLWIEMILKEGKNRQIRRMIEAIGGKVLRLVRVGIGPIQLGTLKKGEWRRLTPAEVEGLRRDISPNSQFP